MISLQKGAYQTAPRISVYEGLSTDTKPTTNIENGAEFDEIDTGAVYRYDKTNNQWRLQP